MFAFVIGIVGLISKFILGMEFLDWDHGLTTAFFLGGIQLIFLGILGEYIARIYEEVKFRPQYIVREVIGFDERILGDSAYEKSKLSNTSQSNPYFNAL